MIDVTSVHVIIEEAAYPPSLSFLKDAMALGNENTITGMVISVPRLTRYVDIKENVDDAI